MLGSGERAEKVSYLRDGSMLVKTKNERQTKAFLNLKFFQNEEAFASLHPTLNRSFGVISAYDLYDCSEDILEWLKEYGVSAVKRINTKRDGKTVKTNMLKLTFNSHILPQKISTDYEPSYPVRPYIPSPLQCFKCGRFGHVSERCRSSELCLGCGAPRHDDVCGAKRCVNCGSDAHGARYKQCPKYMLEKDICRVKVERQMSYPEARELVEKEKERAQGMTYSRVVSARKSVGTQTMEVSTQTDNTVVTDADDDGPPPLQRETDTFISSISHREIEQGDDDDHSVTLTDSTDTQTEQVNNDDRTDGGAKDPSTCEGDAGPSSQDKAKRKITTGPRQRPGPGSKNPKLKPPAKGAELG